MTDIAKLKAANIEPSEPLIRCEACNGRGDWECECCNGSSGCDCGGQPVHMGPCNVCRGTGWRREDADVLANSKAIKGLCYLGSGPQY